jgi:hypothetical protein
VARGPSVQAHCLSCVRFSVAGRDAPAPASLLEALRARLLD